MLKLAAIVLALALPVRQSRVDRPDGSRPQAARTSSPNPNYPQRAADLGRHK